MTTSIIAQAQAIGYTCGITRSYLMAALCTSLLELYLRWQQEPPTASEDFISQVDDVQEAVALCTCDHALLTANRPAPTECNILHPYFNFTHLEHLEPTAFDTERRLFQELMQHIVVPPLEGIHTNYPYPLCELAITLADQLQKLARQLQLKQAEAKQLHMAEEHNPELQEVLRRSYEAGLMTASGQWEANVTQATKAYWVDHAAHKFGISHQWKWAQDRWGLPNLSRVQNKNLMGQHIPHRQMVDNIFL